jgi:hypothetical protein
MPIGFWTVACKRKGGLQGKRFWYLYGFVNACSCFAFIGSAHSEENVHWYNKKMGITFWLVLDPIVLYP